MGDLKQRPLQLIVRPLCLLLSSRAFIDLVDAGSKVPNGQIPNNPSKTEDKNYLERSRQEEILPVRELITWMSLKGLLVNTQL